MAAAFLGRLYFLALLLAVLLIATLLAAAWLGGTQSGLDWLLVQAQRMTQGKLEIHGARGALARRVELQRVAWRDQDTRVELQGLSGQVAFRSLLAGTLRLEGLSARRIEVAPGPGGGDPPQPVAPPLAVRIPDAFVEELVLLREGSDALRLTSLRFSYAGSEYGHRLQNASAATRWGMLTLEATMGGVPPHEIEASAMLQRLDLAAIDPRLPPTRIDIHIEAAGAAATLLFEGTFAATNPDPGPLDSGRLPVQSLKAQFSMQKDELLLDSILAQAADGIVTGEGRARSSEARLALQLGSVDLNAVRSTLRRTALSGALELAFSPARQRVRGTLRQHDMELFADAVREGDRIEVKALRARAEGGVASGKGEILLGGPPAARGEFRFSGFDPSRFGKYPAGVLNGTAAVSGTLATPRRLAAHWRIERSRLAGKELASRGAATLEGERVRSLHAAATWGPNRLSATGALGAPRDTLAWNIDARALPVDAVSGHLIAQGTLQGELRDPRIEFTAQMKPFEAAGRLRARTVEAAGRGTLRAHQVRFSATGRDFHVSASLEGGRQGETGWQGRLVALANQGRYPAKLQEPVPIAVSPRVVRLGGLRAQLGDGFIAIERLEWRPGGGLDIETAGRFSGLPAAWLVAAAGAGERLHSTLLLDGEWNIGSSPRLNGKLGVRRAAGDLALTEPVQLEFGLKQALLEARFESGRVSAKLEADSRIGALDVRASAAGLEPSDALQAQIELRLADLRALAARLPPEVRIGGNATATLSARGTLGAPELAGSLRAAELSVQSPPYGVSLGPGVLRAELAGKLLRVAELSLQGGDGRFTASGTLPLTRDAKAAKLQWRAQSLQLVRRPDVQLVVSGEGEAAIDGDRARLQGNIALERGFLERALEGLPELDEDIVVAGRKQAKTSQKPRSPLDLALQVDLGKRFKLRLAGFDGLLTGKVLVRADAGGEPRAFGAIHAADATYRAYGRTLAVDPGELIFDGPARNPSLRIEAWQRNQEVAAGVRITGYLGQPRVELLSEPPLPEGAKLSWLMLGRAPGDAAGADIALLQAATTALLGRGGSVPITTRLADRLGLDELGVRGSSQLQAGVLAVGKRLGDRLYLSYEQGIGAVAQNLLKIDLSLTDRISLRAQTGTTSGGGVYYRYSWN